MKPGSIAFETDRLRVSDWRNDRPNPAPQDALRGELSRLLTPAVLHPLPEPLQLADEQDAIDRWIAERNRESDVYLVRERHSSELVGLLILAAFREGDTAETLHLGYLIAEPCWGRGYATELLSGLVQHLRTAAPSLLLHAGVGVDNPGSRRVLEKAGFQRVEALCNTDTEVFTLTL